MFIENKNNSNKADRESNLTQKFETHSCEEIRYSNRHETLYTDDNDDKSCNSYDSSTSSDSITSSDEISDKIS